MANNVTLGNAYVVIGGKISSSFTSAINNVKKSLDSIGDSLIKVGGLSAAAGAAIVAPLTKITDSVVKSTEEIAKASRRASTSTEFMSEMGHAARLSGSDMDTFEKSLIRMQNSIYDAGSGLKAAQDAFNELGIDISDIASKSTEDQFYAIADAISKITDTSKRAALAQDILGKGGAKLLPLLQGGSEGISGARQEAKRLGISISPADAKAAEDYVDIMERISAATTGLRLVIAREVLPTLQRMSLYMTNFIVNVKDYLSANPQLIKAIFDFGQKLLIAGAAITGIGVAFKALSVVVSPGGVLFAIAGLIVYMTGALDDTIAKWKDTVLAFEVGGKTIGSWLTSIGEAWQATLPLFSEIAKSVGQVFSNVWDYIVQSANNILPKVGEALTRGFYKAAKSIAGIAATLIQKFLDAEYALYIIDTNEYLKRSKDVDKLKKNIDSFYDAKAAGAKAASGPEAEFKPVDFSNISAALESAKSGIKESLGKPIADVFAGIFGKDSTVATSLSDIFKNLGREFALNTEIDTPEAREREKKNEEAKKAISLAQSIRGTFSGLAAGQLTSRDNVIQQQQLFALREIAVNTAKIQYGYGE